jgi:hypothetical protein
VEYGMVHFEHKEALCDSKQSEYRKERRYAKLNYIEHV